MGKPKIATPVEQPPVQMTPATSGESRSSQDAYEVERRRLSGQYGRNKTMLTNYNYGIGGKTLLGQ